MSQLKVYNAFKSTPAFSEGALKSHFSWHILSRGNAFDTFAPEVIKEATREHPLDEIEFVAQDFTSINFGWVNYVVPGEKTMGMQPDMFEYVYSKATGWDCPVSLEGKLEALKSHPRTNDNLEAMRRWEEARLSNFFSEEQKAELKNQMQEYTLLIDEKGRFELQPYSQIVDAAGAKSPIRAFVLSRSGKTVVIYWHTSGEGKLKLDINPAKVHLFKEFGKKIPVKRENGTIVVPAGDRHYLEIDLPKEEAVAIFKTARIMASTK